MSWIIEQNLNKTIDVADVYFKAKELLEYEKNLLKKDVEILNQISYLYYMKKETIKIDFSWFNNSNMGND